MDRGRLIPPNLDDRSWKDIVEQAKALIPQYAPEWTDHSPSDLGITLIELFAWITEGMIYRLNKVPEKSYLTLLNLIGVTRDPATPAQTILQFRSDKECEIKSGQQVSTPPTEATSGILFETEHDLTVLPFDGQRALYKPSSDDHAGNPDAKLVDELVVPPLNPLVLSLSPGQPRAIVLLGFLGTIVPDKVDLLLRISTKDGTLDRATWKYLKGSPGGSAFVDVPTISDGTKGFSLVGTATVSLRSLTDWVAGKQGPAPVSTEEFYWLMLELETSTSFRCSLDFAISNSVVATNAISIAAPEIFSSDGSPFFSVELARRPLYRKPNSVDPFAHLVISVDGQRWTRYEELPPGDEPGYMLNPVTGTITFGDFDRTTAPDGHGRVPAKGSSIEVSKYRYVAGGEDANVGSGVLTIPIQTQPGINVTVSNVVEAIDGSNEEPVEETIRRAPGALRNRSRAVTVDDFEYLTQEASRDVAKVRCLEGVVAKGVGGNAEETFTRETGQVTVLVVPRTPIHVSKPQPSDELIRTVKQFLNDRRVVGTRLHVRGPTFHPIDVRGEVTVFQQAISDRVVDQDVLKKVLEDRVRQFLHPIHGGPNQNGWSIGEAVTIQSLLAYLQVPAEVGYVSKLFFGSDAVPQQRVNLDENEIAYAGDNINVNPVVV